MPPPARTPPGRAPQRRDDTTDATELTDLSFAYYDDDETEMMTPASSRKKSKNEVSAGSMAPASSRGPAFSAAPMPAQPFAPPPYAMQPMQFAPPLTAPPMMATMSAGIVGDMSYLEKPIQNFLSSFHFGVMAPISHNVRWTALSCPINWTYLCCFDKILKRYYIMIHDRAIVSNIPRVNPICCLLSWLCCCLPAQDNTRIHHIDKWGHFTRRKCCTPYHCCCCVECCGGVVAEYPCAGCSSCLCCCFHKYHIGLQNPDAFAEQANLFRRNFKAVS
jgi:hypothetical protein